MRNTVSHLLSRLLNSGAAFDAPASRSHGGTERQEDAPQTVQEAAQEAGWQRPGCIHDETPSDDSKRRDDCR